LNLVPHHNKSLDFEAAELLLEVGTAIVVVIPGRGGFVIVNAVEDVTLVAPVGAADPSLENGVPTKEVRSTGGSVL